MAPDVLLAFSIFITLVVLSIDPGPQVVRGSEGGDSIQTRRDDVA